RNAIDDEALVALRIGRDRVGRKVGLEIWLARRDGGPEVAATWHRHADLRTCLPIFVVVAGEGELRHWVVAPFPLRRALRKRMREENAGSVALVQARRGLFAQTEERFGHGIGSILAGRSVTGVELGAQNSAAQSPQRIALDTTREPLEESVHLRRP